jgi:arsenate reductase
VKILKNEKKEFTIIEYLKVGLDINELKNILSILSIEPIKLIRQNDKTFKELNLSKTQLSDTDLLTKILIENPKIIQRPIIINNKKGVIGRPPEKIFEIL